MQCVSAVSDEVTSVRHVMEHNPGPSPGRLQSCVGASQIRPTLTVSAHSDVLTRLFAKKTINTRRGPTHLAFVSQLACTNITAIKHNN